MSSQRPSICFVAPNNYAVLSGDPTVKHIGGAEVQRALIARELVQRGWSVSFVTLDHGQTDCIEHDGIRVYKAYAKTAGVPGVRFFHPRWTGLRAAMRRSDADIYIQRTAGIETGQVAHWARANHRKFIYAVASEPECDERVGNRASWRERTFFQYGLRRANAVVAQTQRQVELLGDTYGINAKLIRSAGIDAGVELSVESIAARRRKQRVLWVGRFSRPKRVDRLLDIVRACPDTQFDVVGDHPNPTADISTAITALRGQPNAKMHGFVPYREMPKYYDAAALLLCTSEWEGFPNTFIEAWARGIPVISSVDPDGIIAVNGCGKTFDSVEAARNAIQSILNDEQTYQTAAHSARSCFLQSHSIRNVTTDWETLLSSL